MPRLYDLPRVTLDSHGGQGYDLVTGMELIFHDITTGLYCAEGRPVAPVGARRIRGGRHGQSSRCNRGSKV